MNITRNNYESYFIDFLDGKLNATDIANLKTFLKLNPDLEAELHEFSFTKITDETLKFQYKESLYKNINVVKNINENNFEEFCIAYYEKDLDNNAENKLHEYLYLYPNERKVFNIYSKTFVKPDSDILFNSKSKLKHRKIQLARPLIYTISVAASISLIFLVYKNMASEKPVVNKISGSIEIAYIQPIEYKSKTQESLRPIINNSLVSKTIESPLKKDSIVDRFPELIALKTKIEDTQIPSENFIPIESEKVQTNLASETITAENINEPSTDKTNIVFQTFKAYYSNVIGENKANLFGYFNSGVKSLANMVGIHYKTNPKNNRTIYTFDSKLLSFYSSKDK
jgi:hypothetical protein